MPTTGTLWRQHIGLFARFELQRLLQTPRGWFGLAAFVVVWYFLLRYPIYEASALIEQPKVQAMLNQLLGVVGLNNLLRWPLPELSVYWLLTLVVLPVAVLFSSADQTCSDRARGTLRLYTLRSSRDAIFFGRFVGQLLVQLLLITLSLLATLAVASWRSNTLPSPEALATAALITLNLMIVLLPVTALMALCSALAKSSRLAISLAVVAIGVVFGLCGYLVWQFPDLQPLLSYLPLAQLPALLQSEGLASLQHAWLPLCQTGLLLLAGVLVIRRRSL